MNRVKVFSATMAKEREGLGEVVTEWIKGYRGTVEEVRTMQSSDEAFHCVTIILLCQDK